MTTDNIYPEDSGTNSGVPSEGGDDADAANFASVYHALAGKDRVVKGLMISNVSGGTFDVSEGKAIVSDLSADAAQSNETRDQGVAYKVTAEARTGLVYTEGLLNHIYLNPILDDGNNVNIEVNTSGSDPFNPSLKIAEIDDS